MKSQLFFITLLALIGSAQTQLAAKESTKTYIGGIYYTIHREGEAPPYASIAPRQHQSQGAFPENAFFMSNCFWAEFGEKTHPVVFVEDSAFYDCNRRLRSIVLPASLTSIGASAFEKCASLTSVSIDTLVTTIGEKAFKDCSALTEIYSYNETPPSCGENVFSGVSPENCTLYVPFGTSAAYREADGWSQIANIVERQRFTVDSITYRTMGDNAVEIIWSEWAYDKYAHFGQPKPYPDITLILSASVSNNGKDYKVSAIAPYSFHHLPLTFVTIPGSIETVGEMAFSSTAIKTLIIEEGVKTIETGAFLPTQFYDSQLESVTIANSVESIERAAFNSSKKLTTLTLGNGIKHIGAYAFSGAILIESITLPESIEKIAEGAFSDCHNLNSINFKGATQPTEEAVIEKTLPQSLEIEKLAFMHCGIKAIWLPANVTKLGIQALSCYYLKDLYIEALEPPLCEENMFAPGYSPENIIPHVPEESLELYKNAVGWSRLFETISMEESTANKFTVSQQGNILMVEGLKERETLSLYSSSGVLLYSLTITDSRAELPLPSSPDGIYIISDGKKSIKIVL